MLFNESLRTLRQKKGLTQEGLSKATGIGKSAIGMYETGKREPDFVTLEIFADFFNVDMNVLLGWEEDEPTDGYYLDPEAAQYAQEIAENPDLRMLFDASRKVSKNDLQTVVRIIQGLKNKEQGDE